MTLLDCFAAFPCEDKIDSVDPYRQSGWFLKRFLGLGYRFGIMGVEG